MSYAANYDLSLLYLNLCWEIRGEFPRIRVWIRGKQNPTYIRDIRGISVGETVTTVNPFIIYEKNVCTYACVYKY